MGKGILWQRDKDGTGVNQRQLNVGRLPAAGNAASSENNSSAAPQPAAQ